MTRKNLGMDEADMEDNAPTLNLVDEEGRSLLCYVERSLTVKGTQYVLLLPVDAPIEVFAWAVDEDNEDEEMLVDIEEEELEQVFSTARAVLAEQDLILQQTALTLTASGELPDLINEEDIITLDVEDAEDGPNYEQFQQLASFFHEEQEYVICSPLDPLLFFAQLNENGEPELVSLEELQSLLELEEFKELRSQLELQAQLYEDVDE